jgi:hypothetical protein
MFALLRRRRTAVTRRKPPREPLFAVSPAGDHVFAYVSGPELLERYSALIRKIRYALDAPPSVWSGAALPLIRSLASCVSALPASEAVHDPDAGGLFRHSLLTALNAMADLESDSALATSGRATARSCLR